MAEEKPKHKGRKLFMTVFAPTPRHWGPRNIFTLAFIDAMDSKNFNVVRHGGRKSAIFSFEFKLHPIISNNLNNANAFHFTSFNPGLVLNRRSLMNLVISKFGEDYVFSRIFPFSYHYVGEPPQEKYLGGREDRWIIKHNLDRDYSYQAVSTSKKIGETVEKLAVRLRERAKDKLEKIKAALPEADDESSEAADVLPEADAGSPEAAPEAADSSTEAFPEDSPEDPPEASLEASKIDFERNAFIVQKEISPMLYEGRKFSIRVFLVDIDQNGVYLFKDGIVYISPEKYDERSFDPRVLIPESAACDDENVVKRLSLFAELGITIEDIAEFLEPFIGLFEANPKYDFRRVKTYFQILFCDLLVDSEMKIWLNDIHIGDWISKHPPVAWYTIFDMTKASILKVFFGERDDMFVKVATYSKKLEVTKPKEEGIYRFAITEKKEGEKDDEPADEIEDYLDADILIKKIMGDSFTCGKPATDKPEGP